MNSSTAEKNDTGVFRECISDIRMKRTKDIEGILRYVAPTWVKNITSRQQRLLNSIQRKFLLNITGAYSTTPKAALQVIEDITPLHINVQI
ncbi:hypothetical protein AVEN_59338-1 [Araneus ventricosus]|uniref:Uncharacterized protein n=1 Tax=Araneus ventricosus TaxID=182803 RepID=A0A4Y2HPR0_ARAVE|nr:hypothetical protein AVEN_59338-1 [Araneus ventricosus]